MAESRWLSRMPVYDIARGRVVGRVSRLLVDADARKVVGLLLATRLGREPRCLPFRHVHAIGEHAVTVRGTDAIAPLSRLPDMEEALRSQRRIYNSPILTEGGVFVGDVDEFTINTESGRLETLLVSGGLIQDLFRGQAALPSHLVVAIGEDATIVKDVAVTYLKERRQAQRENNKEDSARGAPGPAEGSWRERLRRALTVRRPAGGHQDRPAAGDQGPRLAPDDPEQRRAAAGEEPRARANGANADVAERMPHRPAEGHGEHRPAAQVDDTPVRSRWPGDEDRDPPVPAKTEGGAPPEG